MSKNNENKLVPRLRFPEFRNEEGWEMKKVGEVIEESKVPSTSNNPHNRITVRLNQKGVEKREVRGTEADNATYFFIRRKGQFIYGKQNLHKGAFGLIPDELDGFESSQDIPAFDFKNGYYPQYFVYYLGQENVYPDLEKISTGTGSKRIHPRDLFQVKFPFPKTEEQQKIAACLSSLDDVITAESKKLEVLKEHKKGLLQNLFPQEGETVPKLRFKEFEDSGEWKVMTIEQVAKVTTGNKDTQNKVDNGEYPFFVRSQNVERINSYSYDGEAILTSGDGVGVGKNFHYINGKFDFHQRVYCIYEFEKEVSGRFVYMYFSQHFFERVMRMSAKNSVDSVRMAMITEMPILIPSKKEQQKIADTLSSIDNLINAQSQKIETLKLHKKGLLQGLFPDVNEHNG
jgi:type I restriction enzyme S subunit